MTGCVMGTVAITAGWSWGALLLSLFVSVSVLSRLGGEKKAKRLESVIAKSGERDAVQIIANGAMFTVAAIGSVIAPSPTWNALAAGALAFSAADTWATEIGTLSRSDPLLATTRERVPPGTSGGVTLLGTCAAIAGAIFIATEATFAGWPVGPAAIAGGVAGAYADSVIGATLQARRWCPRCKKSTERIVHDCGTATAHSGGIRWLDNDAVNALCSVIGALVALVLQYSGMYLSSR